jgi:hypothetical protein
MSAVDISESDNTDDYDAILQVYGWRRVEAWDGTDFGYVAEVRRTD